MITDKIKTLCEQKNLSISELLRRARLSPQVFDDWRYNVSPSIAALDKICTVLEVPIHSLFSEEAPSLTTSQKQLLNEWRLLSSLEKESLKKYIKAMLYLDDLKK